MYVVSDSGSDLGTVSATSERVGFESVSVLTPYLSQEWRSIDVQNSNTILELDSGSAVDTDTIVMVWSNLKTTDTWRAIWSSSSGETIGGPTQLADTGLQIPPKEDPYGRQLLIYRRSATVTARYLRVFFYASSNPDGYVRVARLRLSTAEEVAYTSKFTGPGISIDTVVHPESGKDARIYEFPIMLENKGVPTIINEVRSSDRDILAVEDREESETAISVWGKIGHTSVEEYAEFRAWKVTVPVIERVT